MLQRLLVIVVLSIIVASIIFSFMAAGNRETDIIKVVSKERLMKVTTDNGTTSTEYVNYVYSDKEVYVVSDSIWTFHFTSGTVYAKIQPNKTCAIATLGYRIGFLSSFKNIVEAKCW